MYWPYGNGLLKNPNTLHLHIQIRQFSCSKILILGQNLSLWQHCKIMILAKKLHNNIVIKTQASIYVDNYYAVVPSH